MAVRFPALWCVGGLLLIAGSGELRAADSVSFPQQIRPIFEASCWKCHGASIQLSRLDLRTRESALKGGERGPALVPGNAAESRLFRLVAGKEKPGMPMDGTKLTDAQISAIKDWIEQGALWGAENATAPPPAAPAAVEEMPIPPEARKYWAFQRPVTRPVPTTRSARMNGQPIDAFLMKAMEERGLEPAPEADPTTLVRRAYLDLTGLPPSAAETAQFLNDRAADRWERLIDRLLASPHYGEVWGRHWLDVARYADSNCFEHDFDRPNA